MGPGVGRGGPRSVRLRRCNSVLVGTSLEGPKQDPNPARPRGCPPLRTRLFASPAMRNCFQWRNSRRRRNSRTTSSYRERERGAFQRVSRGIMGIAHESREIMRVVAETLATPTPSHPTVSHSTPPLAPSEPPHPTPSPTPHPHTPSQLDPQHRDLPHSHVERRQAKGFRLTPRHADWAAFHAPPCCDAAFLRVSHRIMMLFTGAIRIAAAIRAPRHQELPRQNPARYRAIPRARGAFQRVSREMMRVTGTRFVPRATGRCDKRVSGAF